jgi:LacI family transcriptional regulator
MDDLSKFCCQNPKCADDGKRGAGNLMVNMRYGSQKQGRLLKCKTCRQRFSERKGTPFFDSRLPEEKVVAVLSHPSEGCGVRKTSRLSGVSKDTITRYARLSGGHAPQLHEEWAAFSPGDAGSAMRRKVGLRGQKRSKLQSA